MELEKYNWNIIASGFQKSYNKGVIKSFPLFEKNGFVKWLYTKSNEVFQEIVRKSFSIEYTL